MIVSFDDTNGFGTAAGGGGGGGGGGTVGAYGSLLSLNSAVLCSRSMFSMVSECVAVVVQFQRTNLTFFDSHHMHKSGRFLCFLHLTTSDVTKQPLARSLILRFTVKKAGNFDGPSYFACE